MWLHTNAVITPAISNEIIIVRDDLKNFGLIPRQFPNPVFFVAENKYSGVRDSLIENNQDILTDDLPQGSMETGCISMKIHLTPGERTPFRFSTARQIPLHWREKAECIIKKLLEGGVIMRQDKPTEWCAPGFFVAKKSRDLRLVVDFTCLNKYVKRPIHTFPFIARDIVRNRSLTPKGLQSWMQLRATIRSHWTKKVQTSGRSCSHREGSGFSAPQWACPVQTTNFVDGLIKSSRDYRESGNSSMISSSKSPNIKTLQFRIDELLKRCRCHNFTLSRKKLEIGETVEFAGQIFVAIQPRDTRCTCPQSPCAFYQPHS